MFKFNLQTSKCFFEIPFRKNVVFPSNLRLAGCFFFGFFGFFSLISKERQSKYTFFSITCFVTNFSFLPNFRKPFGNVNRWFSTVVNQPQVKKVVGAVVLCEKMAQFDSKKYAEFQVRLCFNKQGYNVNFLIGLYRFDFALIIQLNSKPKFRAI